jgi:ribonuclease P protein component
MIKFKALFSFKKKEVERAFSNAKLVKQIPGLKLLQAPCDYDYGKLLIVIPKKVGTAITRNRLKRQIKSIFYEEEMFSPAKGGGVTLILMIYKPALEMSREEIKNFLIKNDPTKNNPPKKSGGSKFIHAIIDSIRLQLGPRGVCIYPVTCRQYMKAMLKQKPFYVALPLIFFRLLSCNPITALYFRVKNKLR